MSGYEITVCIQKPDTLIPESFENQTFFSPIFEWLNHLNTGPVLQRLVPQAPKNAVLVAVDGQPFENRTI